MAAQRRRRRSSQREAAAAPVVIRASKNPSVAAVLSALLPGLCQIFNGQLAKGVLLLVAFVISCLLIVAVVGVFIAPILWIAGIVDAYRTAQALDRPSSPARSAKPRERDDLPEFLSDGSPLPEPSHTVLRDTPLHDLDAPPTFRTIMQTLPAGTRVAVLTEDEDGWVEVATASGLEGLVQAAALRPLAFTEQAPEAAVLGSGAGGPHAPGQGARPVEHWRAVLPWIVALVAVVEALALLRQALVRGDASWGAFAVLLLLLAAWVTNIGGLQGRVPVRRLNDGVGGLLGWGALVVLLGLGGVAAFVPAQSSQTPASSVAERAPAPTARPGQQPTSGRDREALQAYLDYVTPELNVANEAVAALNRGAARVGPNPQLVDDPTWKSQMAFILANFAVTADKLEKAPTPPFTAQPLHNTVLQLVGDLRYVANEMARGLDNRSPQNINNAKPRLDAMNTRLEQAQQQAKNLAN